MNALITRDLQLAKILASNDKKLRDRALARLKKWFEIRSQTTPFTELDFMRIWKGLFYYLWMSDKPLVQEKCAESISALVHFKVPDASLLFFKCGLQTMCNEWFGIDQLRLGKFSLFVRRFLRQGLVVLRDDSWNVRLIKKFNDVLSATVLGERAPGGLTAHFVEIYLEELAKVSKGELKPYALTETLGPFVRCLARCDDARLIGCVKQNVFHHLIRQSDAGFEYEEKFRAWKREGFPGASINSMRKEELPSDDGGGDREGSGGGAGGGDVQLLDPRAGHVDVELPQLKFSSKQIIELLVQNKFAQGSNLKSRKAIASLINDFTKLAKGRFPLGVTKLDLPERDGHSTRAKHAVNRLVKFERKLLGKSGKRAKAAKKRKLAPEPFEYAEENAAVSPTGEEEPMREKSDHRCSFRRNSGTWFVYDADESSAEFKLMNGNESGEVAAPSDDDRSPRKKRKRTGTPDNDKNDVVVHTSSPVDGQGFFTPLKNNSWVSKRQKSSSPEDTNDVLRASAPDDDSGEVFAQGEWDFLLKDGGEVEIFLPSVRSLVKNPFSATEKKQQHSPCGTTSKKVKIDLKLNRSQEIHEHVARIKNSPGIPFDANKRPAKPLLKATGINSPINPFYKRKLTL